MAIACPSVGGKSRNLATARVRTILRDKEIAVPDPRQLNLFMSVRSHMRYRNGQWEQVRQHWRRTPAERRRYRAPLLTPMVVVILLK